MPPAFVHSYLGRQTKATLSLAMGLGVKTTHSSWAGLPICLERPSWVFANSVLPLNSEYRDFLRRRSFYGRKEREWVPEVHHCTWNSYLCFTYSHSSMVPLFVPCKRHNIATGDAPPTGHEEERWVREEEEEERGFTFEGYHHHGS